METFITIEDCPNYQISNLGRVKNIKTNRIMKFYLVRGYNKIDLRNKEGKIRKALIHRLVLENFDKKSELSVDHINNIRTDNRLENLQWLSLAENTRKSHLGKSKISFKDRIKTLFESKNFNNVEDFYKEIMNM